MEACKFAVPVEVPDGSGERKDLPYTLAKHNPNLVALLLTDMSTSVVYKPSMRKRKRARKGTVSPASVPEVFLASVEERSGTTNRERGVMWLEDVLYAKAHALRCLESTGEQRESQDTASGRSQAPSEHETNCTAMFFSYCLEFAWERKLVLGGSKGKTFRTWSTVRPVLQQMFIDNMQSESVSPATEVLLNKCLRDLGENNEAVRAEHLEVPELLLHPTRKAKLQAWINENPPSLPAELSNVWRSVLTQAYKSCPCTPAARSSACEIHKPDATVETLVEWLAKAPLWGRRSPHDVQLSRCVTHWLCHTGNNYCCFMMTVVAHQGFR